MAETTQYPSDASAATYLLTVRGTITAPSVEEARGIHNSTAGNRPVSRRPAHSAI